MSCQLSAFQIMVLSLANLSLHDLEQEYDDEALSSLALRRDRAAEKAAHCFLGAKYCRAAAQSMLRRIFAAVAPQDPGSFQWKIDPDLPGLIRIVEGLLRLDRAEALRYPLSGLPNFSIDDLCRLVRSRTRSCVAGLKELRTVPMQHVTLLQCYLRCAEPAGMLWIRLRQGEGTAELVRGTISSRMRELIEALVEEAFGPAAEAVEQSADRAAKLAGPEIDRLVRQLASDPSISMIIE